MILFLDEEVKFVENLLSVNERVERMAASGFLKLLLDLTFYY